jgi:hypothetical protein
MVYRNGYPPGGSTLSNAHNSTAESDDFTPNANSADSQRRLHE